MNVLRHYEMTLTDDEARLLVSQLDAAAASLHSSSQHGDATLLERVTSRFTPSAAEDLNSDRRRSAIVAQAGRWRAGEWEQSMELEFQLASDSQLPGWLSEAVQGRDLRRPAHPEYSGIFVVDGYVPWFDLMQRHPSAIFARNMESPDRAALEIVEGLRSEGFEAHVVAEVLLEHVRENGELTFSVQALELVSGGDLELNRREHVGRYLRDAWGNLQGPVRRGLKHDSDCRGERWGFA